METGWIASNGKLYYLDVKNGHMKTGWIQYTGDWYYLDPVHGHMKTGWIKDAGKWYFIDSFLGCMVTGWVEINGTYYHLKSNGAMSASQWVVSPDGEEQWYVNGSGARTQTKPIENQKPPVTNENPGQKPNSPAVTKPEQNQPAQTKPGQNKPDVTKPEVQQPEQKPVLQAKYSYEVYSIQKEFYNSSEKYPFFVKTDNPEGSHFDPATHGWTKDHYITFNVENLTSGSRYTLSGAREHYDNVNYLDTYPIRLASYGRYPNPYQVKGGYILPVIFGDPGTYRISIIEETEQGRVENIAPFTVQVKSFDDAADRWMDSVIDKYTDSSMDPFEKMESICSGLHSEFHYYKTYLSGNSNIWVLPIEDAGNPFFINKEWDSYLSPMYLCKIAEKLGSFSNIHNCYNDQDNWSYNHYWIKVTWNGETRRFECCPPTDYNLVQPESLPKFDFNNTGRMHRMS